MDWWAGSSVKLKKECMLCLIKGINVIGEQVFNYRADVFLVFSLYFWNLRHFAQCGHDDGCNGLFAVVVMTFAC
jgi:hypothetical protein